MNNLLRFLKHSCFKLFIAIGCFLPLIVSGQTKLKATQNAYAAASYKGMNNGSYLKNWWLAGPLFISEDSVKRTDLQVQEKFFNDDRVSFVKLESGKFLPFQNQLKNAEWKLYQSPETVVDLDKFFNKVDYAVAYALAEIQMDSAKLAFLAVGSDDGIRVWHNGKPVHKNLAYRALTPDEDLVPIQLIKGSNQLLLQVMDAQQGWGFTARFLDKKGISEKLPDAVSKGNIDEVDMLVKAGADVHHKGASGLSAMNIARLSGRKEIEKILLTNARAKDPMPPATLLVDSLYAGLNSKQAPGIAMLVAKDGEVLYKKAFGFSDLENKKRINTDTKFRIGSITKQFTASAILKLQEAGKLSITDKLSKYLPEFPRADEVTLYQLLTHTSGIHSYTGKDDFFTRVLSPVRYDSLLAYFMHDRYDFNPGENYAYNNSGYFLLGYIIEKLSGKSYGDYLTEVFFKPLGMENTGLHRSDLVLENEAKGYTQAGNHYERALNWDMSWAAGAGALYSTVGDLLKWNEAVFSGKVLSEANLKAATTPAVLKGGKTPPVKYGFGWIMSDYRGQPVIEHSGGLHGFVSQLSYYPKEKFAVILLTNLYPPEVNLSTSKIAEYFLWEKMEPQSSHRETRIAASDLEKFAGRYDFTSAVMTITTDGKELFAQLSGQNKFQIFPSAANEFFWKVVDAKIKFIANEKGEITSAHFKQNNSEIVVPKLKEETIVKIDPAVYNAYLGKYDLGNGRFVMVTVSDNKLYANATDDPRYEMLPLSDSLFLIKELNAKLHFVRNEAKVVESILLEMNGQKMTLKKLPN